jgi:hypothetical protein
MPCDSSSSANHIPPKFGMNSMTRPRPKRRHCNNSSACCLAAVNEHAELAAPIPDTPPPRLRCSPRALSYFVSVTAAILLFIVSAIRIASSNVVPSARSNPSEPGKLSRGWPSGSDAIENVLRPEGTCQNRYLPRSVAMRDLLCHRVQYASGGAGCYGRPASLLYDHVNLYVLSLRSKIPNNE